MTFRMLLWQLGLIRNCPYCGKKLLEHGFRPNQYYTCPTDKCRFNLPNLPITADKVKSNAK